MKVCSGCRKIKEFRSNAAVIMITAYGDIDLAVRSLKEGAADFVVKPWHNEKLIETIKDALKRNTAKTRSAAAPKTESADRQRTDWGKRSYAGYIL